MLRLGSLIVLATLAASLPAMAQEAATPLSSLEIAPVPGIAATVGMLVYVGPPRVTGGRGLVSWSLLDGGSDVSERLPSLCKGLSFSRSTGAIAGMPAVPCDLTLSLSAEDDGGARPDLPARAVSAPFPLFALDLSLAPPREPLRYTAAE